MRPPKPLFLGFVVLFLPVVSGATGAGPAPEETLNRFLTGAEEVAAAERRSYPRAQAFVEIATAYQRTGEASSASKAAQRAIEAFQNRKGADYQLSQLSKKLANGGLFGPARDALKTVNKPSLLAQGYAQLAVILAREPRPTEASEAARKAADSLARISDDRSFVSNLRNVLDSLSKAPAGSVPGPVFSGLRANILDRRQPHRDRALRRLSAAAREQGHIAVAARICTGIEESSSRCRCLLETASWATAAEPQHAQDQLEAARKAAGAASDKNRLSLLAEIAAAYARMGVERESESIIKELKKAVGEAAGDEMRVSALTALVNSHLALGQTEAARQIATEAIPEKERDPLLHRIAQQYAGEGHYQKALAIAEERAQNGRALSVATIVREAAQRSDFDQAQKIAGELTEPHQQDNTYRVAARTAAGKGDMGRARELAGKIDNTFMRYNAYSTVLETALESDAELRADELIDLAQRIRTPADQARALLAAADIALDNDDADLARRIGRKICALPHRDKIGEIAQEVGVLMGQLGMESEAGEFFKIARDDIRQISCSSCRRERMAALRRQMIDAGLLESVIASGMLDASDDPVSALLQAGETLIRRGEKQRGERFIRDALDAAREAESTTDRVRALIDIGRAHSRYEMSWSHHASETIEELVRRTASESLPSTSAASGGDGRINLLYFYTPACSSCQRVSKLLDELKRDYANLNITRRNILEPEAAELNKGLCMQMELPPEKHGIAPAVFGPDSAIVDREISLSSLKKLARSSRGRPVPWRQTQAIQSQGKEAMRQSYRHLTPLVVVGAGLADGVNPCAFAVIVFFLTYMAYVGKSKREMVLAGVIYTGAVFVTYLAIGIGLHRLIAEGLSLSVWLRRGVYAVMSALLLVAAVLSFRDGLLCLKDQTDRVTLRLPDAVKRRIHLHVTRRTRQGLTVFGALSLGIIVALLEFPCTGQTYLPIITYLSSQPLQAVLWLVLYNLCFILPLVAVFLCVLFGASSEQIKNLFQKHMAKAKFALSGIFLLLALVLLLTFP